MQDRITHIFKFIDWEQLTDWEQEFMESVEGQYKAKGHLSEKQMEVMERIYKDRQ